MNLLEMLLFLVAAVFFGVAAFRGAPRPHWGWLGAMTLALAFVLPELLAAT